MTRSFTLFMVLALGLWGCHSTAPLPPLPAWQSPDGHEHAQLGVIRETVSGERLTPEALVQRLAAAQRVLVGEQHDNPDHHALQRWLLQSLDAQRPQGSLLLEMLEPAQQLKVDRVREQTSAPSDLAKALDWQPGWDWTFYGPILQDAFSRGYPVLAANLDRSEIKVIYRNPPPLSGSRSTAPAVRETLLQEVRDGHCGMLSEKQLPPMLAVQQQRDRRMAQRLLQAPVPTLLLAGAYHVRKDVGAPLHLADLGEKDGARVLMLAQVGEEVTAQMADFVWYTAAVPKRDYCADFRGGIAGKKRPGKVPGQ